MIATNANMRHSRDQYHSRDQCHSQDQRFYQDDVIDDGYRADDELSELSYDGDNEQYQVNRIIRRESQQLTQ